MPWKNDNVSLIAKYLHSTIYHVIFLEKNGIKHIFYIKKTVQVIAVIE